MPTPPLTDERLLKHAADVAGVIAQQGPDTWWPVIPAWELQAMIAELQAARKIVGAIAADDHPMMEHGNGDLDCWYCGVFYLPEPTQHEPDCPWLLARRLRGKTDDP